MGIRGPKPGATEGCKRKAPEELSNNAHTVRFRKRLMSKTDEEKAVIQRKNNGRAAFVNGRLKLRKKARWQNASPQEQEEMEKAWEIMRTRYAYFVTIITAFSNAALIL